MLIAPTPDHVRAGIDRFDSDPRSRSAEDAVSLVFRRWPNNVNYHEVLVKVIVLNRLYSTNIYDPYTVAQHILTLAFDDRLIAGDPALVGELASVQFGQRTRVLYSFATKYCAWHQPDLFQVYDSYVDRLLWEYRRAFQFAEFRRDDLRDYRRYVAVVQALRDRFGLHGFSRKEIDKFLWIEGSTQRGRVSPPTNSAM